jgi:hypothetical protein
MGVRAAAVWHEVLPGDVVRGRHRVGKAAALRLVLFPHPGLPAPLSLRLAATGAGLSGVFYP